MRAPASAEVDAACVDASLREFETIVKDLPEMELPNLDADSSGEERSFLLPDLDGASESEAGDADAPLGDASTMNGGLGVRGSPCVAGGGVGVKGSPFADGLGVQGNPCVAQMGDADDMPLPLLSGSDSDDDASRLPPEPCDIASGWKSGVDCGVWIHPRWAPLAQQGQVLVVNVCLAFRALGVDRCKEVLRFRCPGRKNAHATHFLAAAANFLGLGVYMVKSIFEKLQMNSWVPHAVAASCSKRRGQKRSAEGHTRDEDALPDLEARFDADQHSRELKALSILIREAMFCAASGATDHAFTCSISRMVLAGVELGQKYHREEFLKLVEEVTSALVRICTLDSLKTRLTGLMIPSDFSVVSDSVSIGGENFSTKETLHLIYVRASSPFTGALKSRLVAAPSQGESHTGPHTRDLILRGLACVPGGGISRTRLQASMVSVGGDGQLEAGGDGEVEGRRRHRSTRTCQLLYEEIFPGLGFWLTWWDLFHREEIGGSWATRESEYATEMFDVGQVMVQLFGVGSGRVILRGVAATLSTLQEEATAFAQQQAARTLAGQAPVQQDRQKEVKPASSNSTRPIAYAHHMTESLFRNYTFYHAGLHARLEYARGQTQDGKRRGSQSVVKLVEVGQRLGCLDFVVFLVLYRDLARRRLRPFAAAAQSDVVEAVTMFGECMDFTRGLREERAHLQPFRFFLWLSVMLRTWLDDGDLQRLWFTLLYTPAGKAYSTFVGHIFSILCQARFKGCRLQYNMRAEAVDSQQFRLVHPRCMCNAMPHRPEPKKACVVKTRLRMKKCTKTCFVPAWAMRPVIDLRHEASAPMLGPSASSGGAAAAAPAASAGSSSTSSSSSSRSSSSSSNRAVEPAAGPRARVYYAGSRVGPSLYNTHFRREGAPHRSFGNFVRDLAVELRVLPRCEYQRQGPTPSHLQGTHRFQKRCVLPLPLVPCYLEVLSVLDAFESLLEGMAKTLESYFGDVGTNATMATLLRAAAVFWNWQHLAVHLPTRRETDALFKAYDILLPTFRRTLWPPEDRCPHVQRIWPGKRQLGWQYALLCWRVRRKMADVEFREAIGRTNAVRVMRFLSPPLFLRLLFRRIFQKKYAGSLRIVLLVHSYLDDKACGSLGIFPAPAPSVGGLSADIWWTSPGMLCLPGHAHQWRSARVARRKVYKFQGRPGSIAQMAVGPAAASLVLVLEDTVEVDPGRLAADFDMNFSWHVPCGKQFRDGCYHVLRLGHRLRFLCPPETPAESGGSLMHILHRKMAKTSFQRLRHRLFIKEAGIQCVGQARDEALVAALAETLLRAGKNPFTRRGGETSSYTLRHLRHRSRHQGAAVDWRLSQHVFDGTFRDFLEKNRTNEDMHDIDPRVAETLRRRCERSFDGASFVRDSWGHKKMPALPLFGAQLRHGTEARSAWRDRLLEWLKSDDGKLWSASRDKRLDPPAAAG